MSLYVNRLKIKSIRVCIWFYINRLKIKSIAHSRGYMDIFLFIESRKNWWAKTRNTNRIFDHIIEEYVMKK